MPYAMSYEPDALKFHSVRSTAPGLFGLRCGAVLFVPLFGVVISQLAANGRTAQRPVQMVPVCIWLVGIACFHALPHWLPALGAALPSLLLTLLLGFAYRLGRPAPPQLAAELAD